MAAGPGRRRRRGAAGALSAVVVALWLLDVLRQGEAGHALPEALARAAILAALAAGAGWLAAAMAALAAITARLAGRPLWALAAALVLPAPLAPSLGGRFAGLGSRGGGRDHPAAGAYSHP